MPQPARCSDACLRLVDCVFALLLEWTFIIFYWAGIWVLFGYYILPGNWPLQQWAITALGSLAIFGYAFHPLLHHALKARDVLGGEGGGVKGALKLCVRALCKRAYMYIYAGLNMAFWRGVWTLGDYYIGPYGWLGAVLCLLVCYTCLLVKKCSRMVIFPPFYVSLDLNDSILVPSTSFNVKPAFSLTYALDAFVTHFVFLSLTILAWRSAWFLADHVLLTLLNLTHLHADLVALVVGLIGTFALFAFEPCLAKVVCKLKRQPRHHQHPEHLTNLNSDSEINRNEKHTPADRQVHSRRCACCGPVTRALLWDDALYVFVFFVCIILWRGGWNLAERLMRLVDLPVGVWTGHVGGSLGLLVFQVFGVVGACGSAKDILHFENDPSKYFPTLYTRVLFRWSQRTRPACLSIEVPFSKNNRPDINNEKNESRDPASESFAPQTANWLPSTDYVGENPADPERESLAETYA